MHSTAGDNSRQRCGAWSDGNHSREQGNLRTLHSDSQRHYSQIMQRVNYPEIEHRKTERQREDAKVNNKEDQQEVEIILDCI